jgi:hypothetical protein
MRRPRADWLNELYVLLLVGLTLATAFTLVDLVSLAFDAPVYAQLDADRAGVTTGSGLRDGVVVDGTVEVRLDHPTARQRALGALSHLPGVFVVVAMLAMLAQMVRHARRADPFTGSMVRRLRWLAATVLIGGTAAEAAEFVASVVLSDSLVTTGAAGTYVFTGQWLLVGVGFLALAEVVNRGTALRAELETVI